MEQLTLPLSWTADETLRAPNGAKLRRWGSVATACRMLGGCDRHDLYGLIRGGLVKAYKLNVTRTNSHWRVDLLSVWEYKQGQMAR